MTRNQFIVNARQFIFDLDDKFPILGHPLVIGWRLLDNFKFTIEKKTLQLRAGLLAGDNQFKKELTLFLRGREAYQPLIHSDPQDVPFLREGESRFKIIKENFSIPKGRLLDIGASLGYFCHKFEDEGFDCYAIEEDRMLCYFMEKLKKAEQKKFKIIPQSIFDYKKKKELSFDVVLALSIFHNFLAREDTYFELIKLLKRLKARELFFETYIPDPASPSGYYKDYAPEEFVSFIIQNSCFKKAEFIGESKDGRPLYKFTPLETRGKNNF